MMAAWAVPKSFSIVSSSDRMTVALTISRSIMVGVMFYFARSKIVLAVQGAWSRRCRVVVTRLGFCNERASFSAPTSTLLITMMVAISPLWRMLGAAPTFFVRLSRE
jgi:hypothetical protein